jgi:hypothetical protein
MMARISEEQATIPDKTFNLPPLILHPFAEPAGPHKLVESSRASLMLQGLLPTGNASAGDLQRALLDGRYSELRMLYYVGKDLLRWMDQCLDCLNRADTALPSVNMQGLASLLIQHTPSNVSEKLKRWGVNDFKSIFSRSLGLNTIFAKAPTPDLLSEEFLRNYYRYADQLYLAFQSQAECQALNPEQFPFELYSSGEYSRMLERSWE